MTTLISPRTAVAELPARSYTMRAPNIPETAKVARDMLAGLLSATGHGTLVETARLLVSEVVANVHLHAAVPHLTVEAVVRGDRLRVSVEDDDPTGIPWRPGIPPGDEEESGRGLLLMQACADSWGAGRLGTGRHRGGKCV